MRRNCERSRVVPRWAQVAVGVMALAVLPSCGGDDDETTTATTVTPSPATTTAPATAPPTTAAPATRCQPAEQQATAVADGLTNGASSLRKAQAVPLSPPVGNYRFVLAAEIQGVGAGQVGTWAVGTLDGGGPVFALDDNAQRYSEWGAAAREGSPADQQRDTIAARSETAAARRCVTG